MRHYFYFRTLTAGFTLLTFVYCSKENQTENPNGAVAPGEQVQEAFDTRYPGATGVVWSAEEGYYVADFTLDAQQACAWFAPDGDWELGKMPASYSGQIEPVVRDAFAHTSYAAWKVKEAYILNRRELTSIYAVSVTNNQVLSNLYFTRNGDFIKVIDGVNHRTDVPVVIPEALLQAIGKLFDRLDIEIADISVIDVINSEISVGMIKDETYVTAIFNRNYAWIVSFWNLTPETVPPAVMEGFRSSRYAGLTLSRIRSMQRATTTTYLFYLVRDNKTLVAEFSADGTLLTAISRDHVMAKYLLNI
jgi:hypothetical protein